MKIISIIYFKKLNIYVRQLQTFYFYLNYLFRGPAKVWWDDA